MPRRNHPKLQKGNWKATIQKKRRSPKPKDLSRSWANNLFRRIKNEEK